MRLYDVASGILLILSIVHKFALAAPALVQEKRQACADVVHISKDVITVLGKRGDGELEKLGAKYFKTLEKPIDASDAHASSSSAPPGPDHGSTNAVQGPGPNPASNPGLLMEPSSTSSVQGALGDPLSEHQWSYKGDDGSASEPLFTPGSPLYHDGSASEPLFTPGSPLYHDGSSHEIVQPNYNPTPSTNPDPDFDWNFWLSLDDPIPPRPALPKQIGLAPGDQVEHVQQQNPGSSKTWYSNPWHPNPGYTNPGYTNPKLADEAFWGQPFEPSDVHPSLSSAPPERGSTNIVQSPVPNPASSTANPGPMVEPPNPSSTAPMQGSWNRFNALWDDLWWYKPGAHVSQPNPVKEPPPGPELTDPELHPDHQLLSTGSQPVDLQAQEAAIYAMKGKAKVSRHVSGTARDVGNTVQRELQPLP